MLRQNTNKTMSSTSNSGSIGMCDAHAIQLLDVVVECALPLLHSKQVPRAIQDALVMLLDSGCQKSQKTNNSAAPKTTSSISMQNACTKHLFALCGESPSSSFQPDSESSKAPSVHSIKRRSSGDHIAAAVAPVVLQRCKQSLLEFVERSRGEAVEVEGVVSESGVTSDHYTQVLHVLEQLQVLNMHPDAKVGSKGSKAHLIALFPVLCGCVEALGKTEEERAVSAALANLFRSISL
mgnify:CR=1 FL=1